MQKYGVTPHCLYRDLLTLKTGVHFRDFSTDRKNNFSETRNYFSRVEKSFRRVGKIYFCQERPGELKRYAKNFRKKTNYLRITWFTF